MPAHPDVTSIAFGRENKYRMWNHIPRSHKGVRRPSRRGVNDQTNTKDLRGSCRGFSDVLRGVREGEKESHLLQFGVGGHAALGVALRQLKHAVVEAVEAGQRHKLECVPQLTQFLHTTSINQRVSAEENTVPEIVQVVHVLAVCTDHPG